MEFIKRKLQVLKSDRLLVASFLAAAIELACHIFEIHTSGINAATIIRALFCGLYLGSFFFICNRVSVYYIFSAMALVILFFNKYTNYTSFFIIAIAIQKDRRLKYPLLFLYSADVLFCLFVGHRLSFQAIEHIVNCAWIYCVLNMDRKPEKLVLTAEERQILDEWVQVRELKAVECFARNTVYDKLKSARCRNHLFDNKSLKARYEDELGTEK